MTISSSSSPSVARDAVNGTATATTGETAAATAAATSIASDTATATALSVNVNLVAYVRNRRAVVGVPDVVSAARICLQAGAHGITVHPRPDERHIRATDVDALADLLRDEFPSAEFNIEGNPHHNLMDFVRRYRPQPSHLRSGHRRASHQRPWLAASGRRRAPAPAGGRMQCARRARQLVHGS